MGGLIRYFGLGEKPIEVETGCMQPTSCISVPLLTFVLCAGCVVGTNNSAFCFLLCRQALQRFRQLKRVACEVRKQFLACFGDGETHATFVVLARLSLDEAFLFQ